MQVTRKILTCPENENSYPLRSKGCTDGPTLIIEELCLIKHKDLWLDWLKSPKKYHLLEFFSLVPEWIKVKTMFLATKYVGNTSFPFIFSGALPLFISPFSWTSFLAYDHCLLVWTDFDSFLLWFSHWWFRPYIF